MPEYIDRDAVYHAISVDGGLNEYEKAYCIDVVRKIPDADVDPVVHGHFVHDGTRFSGGVDWWHCSSCGRLASGVETRFCYCPFCGAKMDGGDDSETD